MLITALVAAAVSFDPAAADTLTLTASADARIDRLNPNTNYGQRMTLRADADGPLNALLKFDVGDLTVLDARLRLRVREGSAVGPMVSAISTAWSEETVTWNTAPPAGTALVALPAAVTGETIEADVTSLLSGEASFAFRISTISRDGMSWYSAEMGSAPELIITTGVDTTATPVASPTASVVATASASGSSASPSPSPAGSLPGSASPVPVGGNGELAFPIRAAFYYPWFPEAWNQQGMNPFTRYHPTLGNYDGGDASVIRSHVEAMLYGHIGAGIASWWGQGSRTDGRIPALLKGAAGTPFRWTIYHEPESLGDPTVSQLRSDLVYLRDRYGSDPAYLRINGKFVVFVYADGSDGCAMADRWRQANTIGAYIVLKVFAGYRNCASQPAGWHQYAPASATDAQAGHSFAISPGFFKANESSARLGRDLTRWKTNIREMIASAAPFQLVTTFNEWGEGTSVEGASEWASSSQLGSYLDALHSDGADGGVAAPTPNPTPNPTPAPTPAPTVSPTPPPPPPTSGTAVLVGAGDIAACSSAGDEATAALLDTLPGTVFTTGDNVYDNGTASEFANCYDPSWGRHRSRTRPAPGNHDYHTSGAAGYFGYFGARAGDSSRGYYAYDLGQWRVYALNSSCGDIGGCGVGSPQYQWLTADLAANPRECVVAYWHHARWSSGAEHGSQTFMQPIWQALYDAGAELVVAGHDHTYERFAPQDGAGNHDATNGVREFVVGTGGRSHYSFGTILPTSEARNSTTFGVLKLTLRDGGYAWDFVPVAGQSYTDSGSGSCHATPPLAFNTSITTGYAATLD